jgi:hypothetical protein
VTEVVEAPKDVETAEKKDDTVLEEKKEEDPEGKITAKTENARVQAVRGDRSGTGGIKKVRIETLQKPFKAVKLTCTSPNSPRKN